MPFDLGAGVLLHPGPQTRTPGFATVGNEVERLLVHRASLKRVDATGIGARPALEAALDRRGDRRLRTSRRSPQQQDPPTGLMTARRCAEVLNQVGEWLIEPEHLAVKERSSHGSGDGVLVESGGFDHRKHAGVGTGRDRRMRLHELDILLQVDHLLRGCRCGMRREAQFHEKVMAGLQHVWILPRSRGGCGIEL